MNQKFDFLEEFGRIDEKFIAEAGETWEKTGHRRLQLYSRKLAGVAAALALCVFAAGNTHVQAALREFTTKIGECLWFAKDLSSYTEIIGQTQTKGGISLTLNEVILDEHRLVVSLKPDWGERKESLPVWVDHEKTTINGHIYDGYGSLVGGNADLELAGQYGMDTDIVLAESYEDMSLPDGESKLHLVLGMGEIDSENMERETAEEFVFDFTISQEELREQTVRKELDLVVGDADKNLTLKSLMLNDLYGRIVAAGPARNDEWVNEYELKLKGTDSAGNPVSFLGAGFISENELRFETDFFGDYEAGELIDEDSFTASVPDKDCAYMDLQLYQRKIVWMPETEVIEDLGDGEEWYWGEAEDGGEAYADDENYGWEPVGEKFRIAME